nr:EF-hand domain-containing protein [Priestia megaterium]
MNEEMKELFEAIDQKYNGRISAYDLEQLLDDLGLEIERI